IQALDLLGRKVRQNDGASYDAWVKAVNKTIHRAAGDNALAPYADTLTQHMDRLAEATLLSRQPDYSTRALANATPYMQAFGHIVIAWLWLDVLIATQESSMTNDAFTQGKCMAMRYFFAYELPKAANWLDLLLNDDSTVLAMQPDWF